MIIHINCPVCDLLLTIEQFPMSYQILHQGCPVDRCPDCQTLLELVQGELVEKDEKEED